MIMQFPSFYPDELLYSLLARYYVRSGYMRYTFAAQDLFQSKTVRPDVEFVNAYTASAYEMLTEDISMEQVVKKHTMFPYYGRFLPKERRKKAFQALVQMQGNYHNLLPIPKRKGNHNRCLRYCPVCADHDRKEYGCTFWHRLHQMQGVNICPLHKCRLMESDVIISGKASPALLAAEIIVPEKLGRPLFCENEMEHKVAGYAAEVFASEMDLQGDVTAGQFLYSRMENTPYRSVRGEQRNIALLHADFTEHYKELPDNRFTEVWQMQKVLTDDRTNFIEICLMALFLCIPANDLVCMKLPKKAQQQIFDEQVYKLHEQGVKYPEIARRLNAPYDTVKAIGERRYGTYHKNHKKLMKTGKKVTDWKRMDCEMLPLVKSAIRQLQGNERTRPKKITVNAVEKLLGLPEKRISLYLPLCKAEIEKYKETQEQYWAREIIWAVSAIIRNGEILNWKHVREMTNMRRESFRSCLKYLEDYAEPEMVEWILRLSDS